MNPSITLQTLLETYWLEQQNSFDINNTNDFKLNLLSILKPFFIHSFEDQELLNEIETFISLKIAESEIPINILSADGHSVWFDENQFQWERWFQYRKFLLKKNRSTDTINILNKTTNEILKNVGDPSSEEFKKKGLVVGYVQSGKTENFISLATKSIDIGYKLIIVLAGLHNDLRSQTQIRIDKELIGKDSFDLTSIGIGNLFTTNVLTNKKSDGDLHNSEVSQLVQLINSGEPSVIVTKKKDTSLNKLNEVLKLVNEDIPVLIIDDECDQASIDTAKSPLNHDRNSESHNPTIVNKMIRTAIKSVKKVSYVGYTATPSANVLIDHQTNHPIHGPDLFPNDFILLLPKNKEYIGPEELFGLEDSLGLPLTRILPKDTSDEELDNVEDYPKLRTAIASFIISGAARAIRGQGEAHNSMLIHINRRNGDQENLRAWVESEFAILKNGITSNENEIIHFLEDIWNKDYIPTSSAIAVFEQLENWKDILKEIQYFVQKIQIMTINGESDDALDYETYRKEGLHVIAIGGDKLSRGLTLEGLTVSYYLRSTNANDTLMQMGRWFGYKGIYKDLCRLYITEELSKDFVDLALSNYEFYEKLKKMKEQGAKPTEFGLSIRSNDRMTVTNRNKMQQAKVTTILKSFSGKKPQMVNIEKSTSDIKFNFNLTEKFIESLGTSPKIDPTHHTSFWNNINLNAIIEYLTKFKTSIESEISSPLKWSEYLKRLLDVNKYTDAHVAIISIQRGDSINLASLSLNPSERLISTINDSDYYISTLRSAQDINKLRDFCNIDEPEKPILLIYPLRLNHRDETPSFDGYCAIGLSMIFPNDGTPTIKEAQNTVYVQTT